MKTETSQAIEEFIEQFGEDELLDRIFTQDPAKETLTIICDSTMHRIPDSVKSGYVYEFSEGQIDTSSSSSVKSHIIEKLKELNTLLRSKQWAKVRIVISGHSLLAPQVKMLVYRVLHIETEDLGYFGEEGYRMVNIDFRADIN